jgi:hypothetical protein
VSKPQNRLHLLTRRLQSQGVVRSKSPLVNFLKDIQAKSNIPKSEHLKENIYKWCVFMGNPLVYKIKGNLEKRGIEEKYVLIKELNCSYIVNVWDFGI